MKSGNPTDNTEIYQDNVWRTASALPFSRNLYSASAITFNNRVLLFGNDENCRYIQKNINRVLNII